MTPEHPQHSPETHRSPRESQERIQDDPILVQRSAEIRQELKVDDERAWSEALQRIVDIPPLPTEANTRNPEQKALLYTQYQLVADSRMELAKTLTAVLAFVDAPDRSLSELDRRALFRQYALYLVEYNAYVKLAGKAEQAIIIPEFLGKDIDVLNENEEAVRIAEMLLPLQYDVTASMKLAESPRDLSRVSEQIVLLIVRYNLRFSHIEECLDSDGQALQDVGPYQKFLKTLGIETVSTNDVEAAKLIVGYLAKHRDAIDAFATVRGRDVSDLTVAEALQCTADLPNVGRLTKDFALQAKAFFNWEATDISGTLENTFTGKEAYPETILRTKLEILKPIAQSVAPDITKEQFEKSAAKISEFFLSEQFNGLRVSVRNLKLHYGELNDVEKKMAEEVCRIGTGDEVLSLLTRALLIPDTGRDNIDDEAAEALGELLHNEQISARDAFDLFYLTRSGRGETSPSIALTFKALHLVRKHDQFLAIELQTSLFDKLSRVAAMNADELAEHLSELGFSEDQQREMANVSQYLRDEGIDKMHEGVYQFLAIHRRYPWLWAFTAGPTTVAMGAVGRRIYIKYNFHQLNAFVDADPDVLRAKHGLPTYVTNEQIKKAQQEMLSILNSRDRLNERWHRFGGSRIRNRANSLRLSYTSRDVESIARSLRGRFIVGRWIGGVSAEQAVNILKHASPSPIQIRTAMESAGYSAEEVSRVLKNVEWPAASKQWIEEAMKRRANILLGDVESFASDATRSAQLAEERVPKFMQELTELEEYFPDLRRNVATEIWGSPLTDDQWKLLEQAHKEPNLRKKMQILENLEGDAKSMTPAARRALRERASKFLRVGIAGEVPVTVLTGPIRSLDQFRELLPRLTPDEIVESLRTLPRIASELDAEEYAKLLRDPAVREKVQGSRALAALDDLGRASERSLKSLRKAGLLRTGGRLAGHALGLFGLYMEYVYVRDSYRELQAAIESGDKAREEIMRSRLISNSLAAGGAVGTGGLMTLGAVGGPVGMGIVATIATVNGTTEYLYRYALDLNEITPEAYRAKSPAELVDIMRGNQDWLLDGQAQKDLRYDTALDAYVLRKAQQGMIGFDEMDEAYLREVVAYDPVMEVNPYDDYQLEKLRPGILDTKIIHWTNDMRSYLWQNRPAKNADGAAWSAALEQAWQYAREEHISRRAEDLEMPKMQNGDASLEAHRRQNARELWITILDLQIDEDIPEFERQVKIRAAIAKSLLSIDYDVYKSGHYLLKHNDEKLLRHNWTVSKLAEEAAWKLVPLVRNPEQFSDAYSKEIEHIRSMLRSGNPVSRRGMESITDPANKFGPSKQRALHERDIER